MNFTEDTRYDAAVEDIVAGVGGDPDRTYMEILTKEGFNALILAAEGVGTPLPPSDSPIYTAERANPTVNRNRWTAAVPMVLTAASPSGASVDLLDVDGNPVTITPTVGGAATVAIPANVVLPLPDGDLVATEAFLTKGPNAMAAVFGIGDVGVIGIGNRVVGIGNVNNYMQVDPPATTA